MNLNRNITIFLLLLVGFNSCVSEFKTNGECCKITKADLLLNQSHDSIFIEQNNLLKSDSNTDTMIMIPSGEFYMGAGDDKWALAREFPQHKVRVDSFYMDVHEVTNRQFAEFVNATGYKTVAELPVDWEVLKLQLPTNTPKPDDSFLEPGSMVFIKTNQIFNLIDYSQWWRWIQGANWKHPQGPGSSIHGMEDYPVVHICYHDALAYANWCGKRLPTEAEWEWASRGGLKNKIYPWGDEGVEVNEAKCNYWTGVFPSSNSKQDGYEGVAPVMSYKPNNFGLYDMAGNVWEICSDWFGENYYQTFNPNEVAYNPQGPDTWEFTPEPLDPKRVVKGGSFLCNDSYCSSYRVSARMPYSQDTGMSHTGFRCVKKSLTFVS